MDEKKSKIMVILLSFQSGRNDEWCERYIEGTLKTNSKLPVESSRNVAREAAHRDKLRHLGIYAEKILSIVAPR